MHDIFKIKFFISKVPIKDKNVIFKPFSHYCLALLFYLHVYGLTILFIACLSDVAIYLCFYIYGRIKLMYQNIALGNESFIDSDYNTSSVDVILWRNRIEAESTRINILSVYSLLVLSYILPTWYKIRLIKRESKLNVSTISFYSERRLEYLREKSQESIDADAKIHISKLFEKSLTIASDLLLDHQNLLITVNPRPEIFYNLKQFMFYLTWKEMKGELPPFIDIVVYMRDILNGVQYLHDRKIFHLNICPDNILIAQCSENESGIAKISGFEFATYSENRAVEHKKVGLKFTYRPPECSFGREINAAALDVWSIGVTAYEVLTGGMLTIMSERINSDQQCHEIIASKNLLMLENFSSAVEACWDYTEFVDGYSNFVKIGDVIYNVSPTHFLKDSWKFVYSLLQLNPKERVSIVKALEARFIKDTINLQLKYRIKCFRVPLYVKFPFPF